MTLLIFTASGVVVDDIDVLPEAETVRSFIEQHQTNRLAAAYIYVIYKPWLGGVYAEYTTRGRGQRKFAAEINPERSEGFIEAANFR